MRVIKANAIPKFIEILIVLYVFHTTIPIFGYYTPAIVHSGIMLLLYVYLAVYDKSFGRNVMMVLPIFSIHILHLLLRSSSFTKELYMELQLFLYPLLALYLMRYADRKALKRILLFIGISYLVTAITTYIGNQIFPYASRNLAAVFQSDEEYMYDVYMKFNIGGFNIIYAYVLLTPVVMYMIRSKVVPRIISILLLIVISLVIVISEYTTAFFSLIMIVASLLVMPKNFGTRHLVGLVSIMFFVLFVFDSFIFPNMASLTGIFGSDLVNARLLELVNLSSGSGAFEGDLGSRYDFYKMSFDSFLKSPIWGSRNATLGGHSYFFDTLGGYGLLGLIAIILMYRQLLKVFYKPFPNNEFYGYSIFVLGIAIMLVILNPKDNITLLTFTVPVIAAFFSKKTQRI